MYRWVFVLALAATACGASPPASTSGVDRIVVGVRGGGWSHINPLDPFSSYTAYVVKADGAGEISTNLPPGLADEPRWSPDGQWVVYSTAFREGARAGSNSRLFLMRADGSQRSEISDYAYDDRAPTWSPDGTRIAYEAGGIRVLNVECYLRGETCRPQPTVLTKGDRPAWSPDGKRIAYINPWPDTYVSIINADGGEPDNLEAALNLANMHCFPPNWSPDGRKVVMWCGKPYIETTWGIYAVNSDGSGLTRLTDNKSDRSPQWSPDGSRIAFVSEREGLGKQRSSLCVEGCDTSNALFIMNTDGSDIKRLTKRDDETIWWYAWMPRDK